MTKTKSETTVPAKPAKKKYLTNKELLREIEKCHANEGKMSDTLAKMIMMLCSRYAKRGEYANYSYNEDMQAFALLTVVKVWRSFDPAKSQNPFAYFTQTIKHAFFQFLNQEKKQRDIRDELLLSNGDNPSAGFLERGEDGEGDSFDHDYYNRMIIPSYEDPAAT